MPSVTRVVGVDGESFLDRPERQSDILLSINAIGYQVDVSLAHFPQSSSLSARRVTESQHRQAGCAPGSLDAHAENHAPTGTDPCAANSAHTGQHPESWTCQAYSRIFFEADQAPTWPRTCWCVISESAIWAALSDEKTSARAGSRPPVASASSSL